MMKKRLDPDLDSTSAADGLRTLKQGGRLHYFDFVRNIAMLGVARVR